MRFDAGDDGQATTVWSTPTIPSASTSWSSSSSGGSIPYYPWHSGTSSEQLNNELPSTTASTEGSIASPSNVAVSGKETPPSVSGTPAYQQQAQYHGFLPLHSNNVGGGLSPSPVTVSYSPIPEHSYYTSHAAAASTYHHHHLHMSSLQQHFANGGYASMMNGLDGSFKFHSMTPSAGMYQQTGSPNSVSSEHGHPGFCSSLDSSHHREVDVVATTPNSTSEQSVAARWSPLTPPHHSQTGIHNLA